MKAFWLISETKYWYRLGLFKEVFHELTVSHHLSLLDPRGYLYLWNSTQTKSWNSVYMLASLKPLAIFSFLTSLINIVFGPLSRPCNSFNLNQFASTCWSISVYIYVLYLSIQVVCFPLRLWYTWSIFLSHSVFSKWSLRVKCKTYTKEQPIIKYWEDFLGSKWRWMLEFSSILETKW